MITCLNEDHSQVEDLSFDISVVEGAVLTKNNSDGISEKLDDYSSIEETPSDDDPYLGYIHELDYLDGPENWRRELDLELGFKYFNTNGKLKSRKIKANLYGFFNGESLLIRGHCEDKNATRHFKIDKIKDCYNLKTDELIIDLEDYLDQVYKDSVHCSLDFLRDENSDLVSGLIYLARVGGNLSKNKRDAIAETLSWFCGDDRVEESTLKNFLIHTLIHQVVLVFRE